MGTKANEDRSDDNQVIKDWDQYMKEFSADSMFTTDLAAREEQVAIINK